MGTVLNLFLLKCFLQQLYIVKFQLEIYNKKETREIQKYELEKRNNVRIKDYLFLKFLYCHHKHLNWSYRNFLELSNIFYFLLGCTKNKYFLSINK